MVCGFTQVIRISAATRAIWTFLQQPQDSHVPVFYFYILGYKVLIKYKQQKHLLVWFSLFMAYIFIVQNRSTLLIAVPFYLYVLLRSDFRIKWLILSILIIGCGSYLLFVFDALMEETRGQLNDTHYNRWQAIYYYVLERDYNFYNTLLGNGKPCAGSPYLYELVRVSKSRLAFVSDIGLIGTFYMYGHCHDAVYLSFCIRGLA